MTFVSSNAIRILVMMKNTSFSPYFTLMLPPLFWAGNWVIGRAFHNEMPPVALAFWRWAIAGLVLAPFAVVPVTKEWGAIKKNWKILFILAVLGTSLYNLLVYWGLQYTTATNGVLLNAAMPILIIMLSAIFLRERLSELQYVGVFISLIGVLIIISHGNPQMLISLSLNVGDFWILIAGVIWAAYTICLRWRPANLSPIVFLTMLIWIGVIPLFPVYLWEISAGKHISLNIVTVTALVYVSIFPGLLGYVFWNRGVQTIGPSKAGLFIHLLPVFGTILSFIFLNERPHWFHALSIGLIFSGIYLTNMHPKKVHLTS